MPHTLNSHKPLRVNADQGSDAGSPLLADVEHSNNGHSNNGKSPPPAAAEARDDWSYATRELLDTLPQAWTRGLLYFLVAFVAVVLPWAMLSNVDETGQARGRLEPEGKTVRLDAPVAGTVAKVLVNEGQVVKEKQLLLELESEPVRSDLQQVEVKLEGQLNRLAQLQLLKNQLAVATGTQQQQNKAQELEKLAQVDQAQQNLDSLTTAYNLQKEEKRAAVQQAQQNLDSLKTAYELQKEEKRAAIQEAQQEVERSQTAYKFANSRLPAAQNKAERYKQAFEEGVISKDRLIEAEQAVEESRLGQQQSQSDIEKAEIRLQEQQSSSESQAHKAQSDIEQAKLRLEEERSRYENIIHQAQSDIEQAKLRLKQQQSGYESVVQAGKLAVLKSEEQLKDLQVQIATLQSEVSQSKSQIQALKFQLAQRVLRAPVSGTIFQLPVQKAGAVVQPSQMVAEIAPLQAPLVLRAQIATGESGALREGMPVKMKFDAYPFQDYGVVEGRLSKIAPSSRVTETAAGEFATYDLEIKLNQGCIPSAGECIALTAGQTATAEVVVRQRRIIDFIIDPFKKLQKGGLKL